MARALFARICCFIGRAGAAAANDVRVRGTIESVDGKTLTVKGRDGAELTVKLAADAPVRSVIRKSLADVKQGGFVGITAMPQPDGTQKAVEIHIFPESHARHRRRPPALGPDAEQHHDQRQYRHAVATTDGKELVLKYKDGEKNFIMPANVEVVMFVPASAADLKPGEKFSSSRRRSFPTGRLSRVHHGRA